MTASTIKTTLHVYSYDVSKDEDKLKYDVLCSRLKHSGLKVMCGIGQDGTNFYRKLNLIDGKEVELETKFLFDNQWNTAPIDGVSENGLRVFDWGETVSPNPSIRRGHYLVQTEEMTTIRQVMVKCGYCGHMERKSDKVFCDECLDSPYLGETELHLTRLKPVAETFQKRAQLSEEEKATLLPRYIERQTAGKNSRMVAKREKQRKRVIADAQKTIDNAETEREGMLWLLDNYIGIDNVIFYSHTGRFCFGWRHPLSAEVKDAMLEELTEFPFAYDLKWTGGTLSAER